MVQDVFLKIENISKTYPGVKALENVKLDIIKGEVHALVGANGAGKSTLIKILGGVEWPDKGANIIIEGRKITFMNALDSVKNGISIIYQDFSLFPNLTVYDNIAISHIVESSKTVIKWSDAIEHSINAIKKLNVDIDINSKVGELSTAKQQLVAIARALAYNSKMIVMDEPTSALSKDEVDALFKAITKLKEEGISILFVSHKLEELFMIADRFSVLRDGKYIGTYNKDEIDDDKLISMMVGKKIENRKKCAGSGEMPLLEVNQLYKKGNFKDISFTLHKGEILGITGIVGAGRTELAQAIFGINKLDRGEILIDSHKVSINSSCDAVKNGIAYVPESRQQQGLVLTKTIMDNISIVVIRKLVGKFKLINKQKKLDLAREWIQKLNIKPNYTDMLVQQLSGGNQQRVVLAKWLAANPRILIVDEPTNGVDVGAKTEIHNIIKDLACQGIGIIVISSELQEIIDLSNRIIVMRKGKISGIFDVENVTHEIIMNKAILENKCTQGSVEKVS